MTPPLLDTHVWVWWLLGDPRLADQDRAALDALPRGRRPVLCDISLWEVALLVQLGRLELNLTLESWLSVAASAAAVRVIPITPPIVAEMNRLPSGFHQNPADRLIVAAARTHDLPLATHDGRILRSGLVTRWQA
jgi:PIN domain nuclease of toxin-antitoxin system